MCLIPLLHPENIVHNVVFSLVGAHLGANILLSINEEIIDKVVGVILLILLPLLFLKKEAGIKRHEVSKIKKIIGYTLYFAIMIFAGFFSGGAGSLVFYTLMIFFGFTIIEANATDMIPWILLSVTSLAIFALNGIVDYYVGITLFIGMIIGGYIGAHIAIKRGDKWIKTLFAIVVIISGIKLLLF